MTMKHLSEVGYTKMLETSANTQIPASFGDYLESAGVVGVVMDTETGGLEPGTPLLEVAAVTIPTKSRPAQAMAAANVTFCFELASKTSPRAIELHLKTGALRDIGGRGLFSAASSKEVADRAAAFLLRTAVEAGNLVMVFGRNPSFDIDVLAAHAPGLRAVLSHRKFDTTAMATVIKFLGGDDFGDAGTVHTAVGDVIRELSVISAATRISLG